MDRGQIVDKVMRLLNYNIKNNTDINNVNLDRDTVIDFVNRAYQEFMRDTEQGKRKTQLNVELDDGKSFKVPVNSDRIENVYYENENIMLDIENFDNIVHL